MQLAGINVAPTHPVYHDCLQCLALESGEGGDRARKAYIDLENTNTKVQQWRP